MNRKVTGFDYLSLSLSAFGGLGLEALYAYLIEPALYGGPMQDWSKTQTIFHWIITCLTWGLVAFYLIMTAKKKYSFHLFEQKPPMKQWQWAAAAGFILFSLLMSYMSWDGFKVWIEFQKKGPLLFSFQYIYYAFETVLFMLIIVFGQKAFEIWTGNRKLPYGGILCGLTWGLVHTLTKGSIWIGLEGLALGFMLGAAYLLVNRDIKKTYIVLLLMFIL
jgi:hypothetical protein